MLSWHGITQLNKLKAQQISSHGLPWSLDCDETAPLVAACDLIRVNAAAASSSALLTEDVSRRRTSGSVKALPSAATPKNQNNQIIAKEQFYQEFIVIHILFIQSLPFNANQVRDGLQLYF